MIRTQIQLETSTYEELKRVSSHMGCSISELARNSIEEALKKVRLREQWGRSLEIAGKHRSGLSDLASGHDSYLADEW